MGTRRGLLVSATIALLVGVVTSVTVAFADKGDNDVNPLNLFYHFLQELKYGMFEQAGTIFDTESSSAAVILQLQNEVIELKSRINYLENPPKVYTTEVLPVTDIDCSNRNMVEAFLSGWCPHPSRSIYFIEDSRVLENSIIAVSLEQKFDDGISEQNVCGVINQSVFNFSFHDEKTGKVVQLEDLHGFIIKCDHSPEEQNTILRYTVVNA